MKVLALAVLFPTEANSVGYSTAG